MHRFAASRLRQQMSAQRASRRGLNRPVAQCACISSVRWTGFSPGLALLLTLALVLAGACNLGRPAPTAAPEPTPALPQVRILSPPHNQRVIAGVVFDIDIHASDQAQGIKRVELYVDEELAQSSESAAGDERHYRVAMNWFAKGLGWHKFAVIAYRADGVASHPDIIALEVVAPG